MKCGLGKVNCEPVIVQVRTGGEVGSGSDWVRLVIRTQCRRQIETAGDGDFERPTAAQLQVPAVGRSGASHGFGNRREATGWPPANRCRGRSVVAGRLTSPQACSDRGSEDFLGGGMTTG